MANVQKSEIRIYHKDQKLDRPGNKTLPGTKPRIEALFFLFGPITSWLYQELCINRQLKQALFPAKGFILLQPFLSQTGYFSVLGITLLKISWDLHKVSVTRTHNLWVIQHVNS